jgi:hypothetical protein
MKETRVKVKLALLANFSSVRCVVVLNIFVSVATAAPCSAVDHRG